MAGVCQIETRPNKDGFGYGPGGITSRVELNTTVTPGPLSLYERGRLYEPFERLVPPPDLAGGHLLSHVKQEPTVAIFNATHEPAKLVQKTSLFTGASPHDIVGAFALRKVGQLRRLFSVIEELIEWDVQRTRHFLERLDGRNRVAVLDARDIATKKSGALFDVPLGKLLFFAQNAKPITDNHVGIVA